MQLDEGLQWMDAHLKEQRERLRENPVRLYVMGAGVWREFAAWPPPAHGTCYYLQGEWGLAPDTPPATALADTYRYDPEHSTPAVGGTQMGARAAGRGSKHPRDNRALEARSDGCFDPLCCVIPARR